MTLRIFSITTEYDESQDRIRLAVADSGQSASVLWLTRRLTERLVPALIKGLRIQGDDVDIQPAEVQAAQVYAQLEARIARKPGKPVMVADLAKQGLVHEMKVKTASNGVRRIEFHCREMETAELVLRPPEMRLWLEVMHRAFVKGQWRLDIWPKWMQSQSKTKP